MLSTIACLIRVTVDLRELPSLEAQIDVLGTITITKIVPSASYGKHTVLPFTGLHCGYVNRTALMNVVRRVAKPLDCFFNLPYRTHNYLVGPLSGQCSIHETLCIRTLKFIRSKLASANPLIAYIGYVAKSSAASPMGQNIAFFRHTFGVMLDDCMTDNLRCIRNYFELSETEAANVSVASELQAMSVTSNGFTNDEMCVMLEAVCIE